MSTTNKSSKSKGSQPNDNRNDASGFDRSMRTERSPVFSSTAKEPGNEFEQTVVANWVKDKIPCQVCGKIDVHTKLYCHSCKKWYHPNPACSGKAVYKEDLKSGKWECFRCENCDVIQLDETEKQKSNDTVVKGPPVPSTSSKMVTEQVEVEPNQPPQVDQIQVETNTDDNLPKQTDSANSRKDANDSKSASSKSSTISNTKYKQSDFLILERLKLIEEARVLKHREIKLLADTLAVDADKEALELRQQALDGNLDGSIKLTSTRGSVREAYQAAIASSRAGKSLFSSVASSVASRDERRASVDKCAGWISKNAPKPNPTTRSVVAAGPNRGDRTISWLDPQVTMEDMLNQTGASSRANTSANLSTSQIRSRMVVAQELPAFDGDARQWPQFITAFMNSTEQCGFTDAENIARLAKALRGEAYEAVKADLLQPALLPTALKTLKMLFGRPDAIFNASITHIRQAPAVKLEKLSTIIMFAMRVKSLCDTMKTAGMTGYLNNPALLSELIEKLPPMMRIEWGRHRIQCEVEEPCISLDTFSSFMAAYAESVSTITSIHSQPPNANEKGAKVQAKQFSHTAEGRENRCYNCQIDGHRLEQCRKFARLSISRRWMVVRMRKLCFCCLEPHFLESCEEKSVCNVDGCNEFHHPLLHSAPTPETKDKRASTKDDNAGGSHKVNNATSTETPRDAPTPVEPNENQSKPIQSNSHTSTHTVHFQIVPITLTNGSKSVSTFAFLDSGSEITLVEDQIVRELDVTGTREPLTLQWTGNVTREEVDSKRVDMNISGTDEQTETFPLVNARTVKQLNLPKQSISLRWLSQIDHLKSVPLECYAKARAQVLIGLDNFQLMAPLMMKEGAWHEPIAIKTRIGWTLFGGNASNDNVSKRMNSHEISNEKLHDLVNETFAMDSIGIRIPEVELETHDDALARATLEKVTKRCADDRYESGLLWKAGKIQLPDSYGMALQRLRSFERKLERDKTLKTEVERQMSEYCALGYLRKLNDDEANTRSPKTWHLPIFAIVNPNKPGKVRLVWDAASEVKGVSLNSMLLIGPDLLTNLTGILFKFRERPIAVGGDIEKMFHQIRIVKEDQEAQRCLWRDETGKIRTYVMTVMIFGASCSPSTAQYVKNLNASRYTSQDPRAVNAIIHRHYVDDFIDSYDTVDDCVATTKRVIEIHREGGFNIRNFVSNSKTVITEIQQQPQINEKEMPKGQDNTKILGMWWDTTEDMLRYRINDERINTTIHGDVELPPTKRMVLKIVMMLFDPLGLLSYLVVRGKLLLKSIWRSNVTWDEPIKAREFERWNEWMSDLRQIVNVSIERCYFSNNNRDKLELHIFCDASEEAAATVCYIVNVSKEQREAVLVAARTKVAPNKPISIPRMELQAAVLGVRLAHHVKTQHSVTFENETYWTDSRNVLCWLRSPRRFKVFVAHRVCEILDTTGSKSWRWVPSDINIADAATKWKKSNAQQPPDRWFVGPKFLTRAPEHWPIEKPSEDIVDVDDLEYRCNLVKVVQPDELRPDMSRFSNFNRLVRTQAYVLRYALRNKERGCLSAAEIERAENYLIVSVQRECFAEDYRTLEQHKSLNANSRLKTYSPILYDNMLRMKGRLENAEYLTFDQRCPIILPRHHMFTWLYIKMIHEKLLHHNHETAMNEIKQRFVIPGLRAQLKSVRARCQRCKIDRTRPNVPEMATLPRSRLAARIRPFSHVGVDYFGPLTVKIGRRFEKRWGAIFTCLTTRAIHLELATALSTDAFFLIFRCFVSRRGQPLSLYSDNGTNFRGAAAELQSLLAVHIQKLVQERYTSIKWHFNPPSAPHMGGAWERLVRSVKTSLEKALPERIPTEACLYSVLCEVEAIVNSRPLTYVDSAADAIEALTPNHFLLGSSSGIKPLGDFTDDPRLLRLEYQRQQVIIKAFWQRWTNEYLPTISKRTKWYDTVDPIRVGDVVAIVLSETPYTWQLGRITEIVQSKDGGVRQAVVKTATGLLRRPASKLAVLVKELRSDPTAPQLGGV